jgi:hypothetical protein
MSAWFMNVRHGFIAATLKQFGQIRRADLVREFGVTLATASNDIASFLANKPPNVRYDVNAKMYVLEDQDDK